jgi:hypothetical protein
VPGRTGAGPGPEPPAPPAPAPPPGPPAPPGPEGDAALAAERKRVGELEAELASLRQQGMTDAEKAIAAAREEGRAEAAAEHARALAAAEFRAQAAGRITNPDAALGALDLGKLLGTDGSPDKNAIGALVEQLAAVPPPGGRVPPGPRDSGNGGGADWVRAAGRRHAPR